MATAIQPVPELLTLEEYLRTSYHPDCDFVDGHLEERALGEYDHSTLQAEIAFWFRAHRTEWNIRVATEYRTRVSPGRVRIPDVSVFPAADSDRSERIRTTPPLIAIEILSPEDRLPRVVLRLDDYLAMGIPHIWLLDPRDRVAYTYTAGGLRLADTLAIPGSSVGLDLPAIFSALD